MMKKSLEIRGKTFIWGEKTYLMGILNITPDSFSDGGEFNCLEGALARSKVMEEAGADIIDIGGQSTRPGAPQISLDEELERVIPIIEYLRPQINLPLSIDTTRVEVAKAAVAAGADIVNDIFGGQYNQEMYAAIAQLGVPYILMHIRGVPETMQQFTDYQDVVKDIYLFFEQRIQQALKYGVDRSQIILDPGIGFAKTYLQNIELIQRLREFHQLDCPLLLGPSRKSFIGHLLNQSNPKERVWGTGAACCGAIAASVDILRVHDVKEMSEVSRVADAIFRGSFSS